MSDSPRAALAGIVVGLAVTAVGIADLTGLTDRTTTDEVQTPVPGRAVVAAEARPRVVPVAPAAPTHVPAPTRIEVPAIGVDERLSARGLKPDGSLDTPDFGDASWYRPGPRPGEPGGAVVVAHVHGPEGPDVFWDLVELGPGDVIRVHRPDAVATFVVDEVDDVPKERLPYDAIWPDTDAPLLRLITCGGERDPQRGYPDNTVVYAHLVSTQPRT